MRIIVYARLDGLVERGQNDKACRKTPIAVFLLSLAISVNPALKLKLRPLPLVLGSHCDKQSFRPRHP